MKGFLKKIKKYINQEKFLVVLLYHKITDVNNKDGLSVSSANYEAQLSFLKSKFKIFISVDEWKDQNESGVLISFDDGYYNNLSKALPIHEKLEIPFTLFNTTYWLNRDRLFWWELLSQKVTKKLLKDGVDERQLTEKLMEQDSVEQKEALISESTLNNTIALTDENRSLSLGEFKKMASHPLVTIGSHTLTHLRLSKVSDSIQTKEIIESKNLMEEIEISDKPILLIVEDNPELLNYISELFSDDSFYVNWFETFLFVYAFEMIIDLISFISTLTRASVSVNRKESKDDKRVSFKSRKGFTTRKRKFNSRL